MSTWRRHRAHRNNRASSMAPPGEEGWTIRDHPAILHSEPYASADLGAASDVDGQVLTVRGCVGLFAEPDLTPTSGWRHLIDAGAKRPWPTPSAQTRDKAGQKARAPGRFSRFSARSAALRRSRQDRCAPFMRTFSQPPTGRAGSGSRLGEGDGISTAVALGRARKGSGAEEHRSRDLASGHETQRRFLASAGPGSMLNVV